LAIVGAVLVLPFCFRLDPAHDRVTLGPVPCGSTCLSHALCGTDCPGCGMGRSFISLAHGRMGDALHYHRLGPALYLFMLALFAYHLWGARQPQGAPRTKLDRHVHRLGWAMTLALLVNWFAGALAAAGNGTL
ncbi:MAG: DUF2752 domain-containing protein, partial [Planctomycetota bacterium]|nr:DUF2752 domain-containing protein [Planctomycetota bacterium]